MSENLPAPKDPINTAVEKSIEEAAETARHYLDKLVAPGLEEGGGIIGDTVAHFRFKNRINLILKTKAFLESKGIDPRKVLPKTAVSILDAASVEDDPDLKHRFTALLINAADPSFNGDVTPKFARILGELMPADARFLDAVYKVTREHGREHSIRALIEDGAVKGFVIGETTVMDDSPLPSEESDGQAMLDNLIRLGLLHSHHAAQTRSGISVTYPIYNHIRMTPLGVAFMRACMIADN